MDSETAILHLLLLDWWDDRSHTVLGTGPCTPVTRRTLSENHIGLIHPEKQPH